MQALAPSTSEVSPRDAVLSSIKNGFNTLPTIRRETGLSDKEILREIEILETLEIERKPGPPITSFWLLGKAPKGRIFISTGGKAVEVVEPVQPPKPKIPAAQEPQQGNDDVLQVLLDSIETRDIYRERVPIESIIPNSENPRGWVDTEEQAFIDLAESIKEIGVQEPLIITPADNGLFRNVMGHRRFAAAVRAGLTVVPCLIRLYPDTNAELEAMLIENIQRKNLTPIQEARAFEKIYRKVNNNLDAVARKTGLTQSYVKNRLKLLNLDAGLQIMVERGELRTSAAEILSSLNHTQQRRLAVRGSQMKHDELRVLVENTKNPLKQPTSPKMLRRDRVTHDDEAFTRSWSQKKLKSLGEGAWIPVPQIIRAFDDVCIDSCLEQKDETLCHGCPIPRFIAAVVRHKERSEK